MLVELPILFLGLFAPRRCSFPLYPSLYQVLSKYFLNTWNPIHRQSIMPLCWWKLSFVHSFRNCRKLLEREPRKSHETPRSLNLVDDWFNFHEALAKLWWEPIMPSKCDRSSPAFPLKENQALWVRFSQLHRLCLCSNLLQQYQCFRIIRGVMGLLTSGCSSPSAQLLVVINSLPSPAPSAVGTENWQIGHC